MDDVIELDFGSVSSYIDGAVLTARIIKSLKIRLGFRYVDVARSAGMPSYKIYRILNQKTSSGDNLWPNERAAQLREQYRGIILTLIAEYGVTIQMIRRTTNLFEEFCKYIGDDICQDYS